MAIQTMVLDPNAQSYTDNEIVTKINSASNQITRSNSVATAARPIADDEVTSDKIAANAVDSAALASGVAKANLDAMSDTARGYIKTTPTTGQFKVVSVQRTSDGKLQASYDDVAA